MIDQITEPLVMLHFWYARIKNCAESLIFVGAHPPAFVLSKRDGLLRHHSTGGPNVFHPKFTSYRWISWTHCWGFECRGQSSISAETRHGFSLVRVQERSVQKRQAINQQASNAQPCFFIAVLIGVGGTLGWQSYGDEAKEMLRTWAPSLGWLIPVSTEAPAPAVTSAEFQEKLKPVALDVAIVRRSVEQLAFNQDQLARKQEQMTGAIAALQAAQQDISQKILALAPHPHRRRSMFRRLKPRSLRRSNWSFSECENV
jgi:hypothetical protein